MAHVPGRGRVALATRARQRFTLHASEAALPLPNLLPPCALASALASSASVGAQVSAIAAARASLDAAAPAERVSLVLCVGCVLAAPDCAPLLRLLLQLLLAARAHAQPNVDSTLLQWLLTLNDAASQYRVLAWTALLEDAALRDGLATPALLTDMHEGAFWQAQPLRIAVAACEQSLKLLLLRSPGAAPPTTGSGGGISAAVLLGACDEVCAALKLASLAIVSSMGKLLTHSTGAGDVAAVEAACCELLAQREHSTTRELLTAAAMALAQSWAMSSAISEGGATPWLCVLHGGDALPESVSSRTLSRWWAGLAVLPRLALLRGLLITLPVDALLGKGGSLPPPLSTVLWEPIASACASPDAALRVYSFQAAESWLGAAQRVATRGGATSSFFECVSHVLPPLLAAIFSTWSLRHRRLASMMTDTFEALLETVTAVRLAAEAEAAKGVLPPNGTIISEATLLALVLTQPRNTIPWCSALMRLTRLPILLPALPHMEGATPHACGVLGLLNATPSLLHDLTWATCGGMEKGSLPASALLSVLVTARQELEASVGLAVGSGGGSSDVWRRGSGRSGDAVLLVVVDEPARVSLLRRATAASAQLANLLAPWESPHAAAHWEGAAAARRFAAAGSRDVAPPPPQAPLGICRGYAVGVDAASISSALSAALQDVESVLPVSEAEIAMLLEEALYGAVYVAWLGCWLHTIARYLLHPTREVRTRAAAYASRQLVSMDAGTGPLLAATLLQLQGKEVEEGDAADDLSSPAERVTSAMLATASSLRGAGWAVLEGESTALATHWRFSPLSLSRAQLLSWVCESDPETSVAALELISTMQAASTPLLPIELDASEAWLAGGGPTTSVPEARKRGVRAFVVLFSRVIVSLRVASRGSNGGSRSKAQVRLAAAAATASSPTTSSPPAVPLVSIACLSSWLQRLITICIASIYPAAPFERIALPLELLLAALDAFGSRDRGSAASATSMMRPPSIAPPRELTCALGQQLLTQSFTARLISLLCETQERVRDMATDLLIALGCGVGDVHSTPSSSIPSRGFLVGYETPSDVEGLLRWALMLTQSPRDRESAGGAAMLRVVHAVYVTCGGWEVALFPTPVCRMPSAAPHFPQHDASATSRAFLMQLLTLVRSRCSGLVAALGEVLALKDANADAVVAVVADVAVEPPSPCAHGLATALRLIIRDVDITAAARSAAGGSESDAPLAALPPAFAPTADIPGWRVLVSTILAELAVLQRLALRVVAGSNETDGDDGEGGGGGGGEVGNAEGEDELVCVAAGRVDCAPNAREQSRIAAAGAAPSTRSEAGPTRAAFSSSSTSLLLGPVSNSVGALQPHATHAHAILGASAPSLPDVHAAARAPHGDDVGDTANTSPANLSYALVVTAWLTTREVTHAVGDLLSRLPLPSAADTSHDTVPPLSSPWLVPVATVRASCESMVASLLSLRHVGSISAVSDALQGVCARLLMSTDMTPSLSTLPSTLLDSLLAHLGGQATHQFVLRRSAGFGASFLALLRSEPRNAPARLLPRALRTLLLIAGASATHLAHSEHEASLRGHGEDDASTFATTADVGLNAPPPHRDWRATVHALNVLCLIFRDGALVEDVVGRYLHPALSTAIAGFSSRAWGVRNSSMMLYAAACDRALGMAGKNARPPKTNAAVAAACLGSGREVLVGSSGAAAALRDDRVVMSSFFSRHPDVGVTLLRELTHATTTTTGAPSVQKQHIQPSLYPVLLLLAKLQPSPLPTDGAVSPQEEGVCSAAPFLPSLCSAMLLGHASAFIRTMTGRALTALAPPPAAATLLQPLLEAALNPSTSQSRPNLTHGLLCATRLVLQAARVTGALGGRGSHMPPPLSQLLHVLSPLLPITAKDSSLPGLIRLEALQCLFECDALASHHHHHHTSTTTTTTSPAMSRNAYAASHHVAHALVLGMGGEQRGGGPPRGDALLHELVGDLCIRDILCTALVAEEGGRAALLMTASLSALLGHASEDVRVGAARGLKRVLKHPEQLWEVRLSGAPPLCAWFNDASSASVASTLLCDTLLQGRLSLETTPCAQRYLLHASALLASASPPSHLITHLARNARVWAVILHAHDNAARGDPSARAHAVSLLGRLLHGLPLQQQQQKSGVDPEEGNAPPPPLTLVRRVLAVITSAMSETRSFSLRMTGLHALHESGLLSIVLLPPSSATSLHMASLRALLVHGAWAPLLGAVQDGDDEVRDAARRAIGGAVCSAGEAFAARCLSELAGWGAAGAEVRTTRLSRHAPKEVAALLCGFAGAEWLPGETALARVARLHETATLILGHAALALAAKDDITSLAPHVAAIAASVVQGVFDVAAPAFSELHSVSSQPPLTDVPPRFATTMLTRPTFISLAHAPGDNDHAEPLIASGLAVALWRATVDAAESSAARILAPDDLTRLLTSAMNTISSAEGVDVGIEPLITHACAWAGGGAEDFAPVHAAARVAVALLAEETDVNVI